MLLKHFVCFRSCDSLPFVRLIYIFLYRAEPSVSDFICLNDDVVKHLAELRKVTSCYSIRYQ